MHIRLMCVECSFECSGPAFSLTPIVLSLRVPLPLCQCSAFNHNPILHYRFPCVSFITILSLASYLECSNITASARIVRTHCVVESRWVSYDDSLTCCPL